MKRRAFKSKYASLEELSRDAYAIINNEPTFTVTLATGTISTVVSNQLVGINSFVGFMPQSSAAAATLTTMSVTTRGDSTFTIEHETASGADKVFTYFVYG